MGLIQYIYTSVLGVQITPQQAYDASMLSAGLCQKFGITGRVFANAQQALAITEGPEEVTSRYFESVSRDSMAATVVLHVKREILAREFPDFSILLNVNCPLRGERFRAAANAGEFAECMAGKPVGQGQNFGGCLYGPGYAGGLSRAFRGPNFVPDAHR